MAWTDPEREREGLWQTEEDEQQHDARKKSGSTHGNSASSTTERQVYQTEAMRTRARKATAECRIAQTIGNARAESESAHRGRKDHGGAELGRASAGCLWRRETCCSSWGQRKHAINAHPRHPRDHNGISLRK